MELSRFDHLIAHTGYSLKRLELLGMAADRISVIRGGRFDHYEELAESGQTGASEDLTGGEHRILFFGALSLYKGVDLLIRALAQLPEATLHKTRLMIYGDEAVDELVYSTDVATMREKGLATCHFEELVTLARENSNIRFILDVKNGPDEFERVYRTIRAQVGDPVLGLSFIPQIYEFEQIEVFRAPPFFTGEIFTAYRSVLTTQQILQADRHFDIRVVTVPLKRFHDWRGELPDDLFVLIHPVNDPFEAARIRERGARGIYTGYLTHSTVPELFGW